jgi:hypothetical protein
MENPNKCSISKQKSHTQKKQPKIVACKYFFNSQTLFVFSFKKKIDINVCINRMEQP